MALKDIVGMPNLPITTEFMGKARPAPKGYIGAEEYAAPMQELMAAEKKAEEDVGKAEVEIEKAKRQEKATEAEMRGELATKIKTEIEGLDERKKLKEARENLANAKFAPTKDNAKDLAAMFSLINVIGVAMGGSGKQASVGALGAMNGMLEGYQKGRADLYKKEQVEFDKNFKVMQEAVKTLEKEFEEAVKLKQYDKEAGEQAITVALAKANSPLFTAMNNRQGSIATLNQIKGLRKGLDEMINLNNSLQKAQDDRIAKEEERRFRLQQKQQAQQKQTQEQARMQRAINALGGVSSALESIVSLPEGATTGWLPNLQTKDGMVNAIRNQLGRKISSVDAELMNTYLSGIGRNLATIEASGLATGLVSLAQQLQSGVYINAGVDDPYKVAGKLADIKRIAIENILPSIEAGTLTPGQIKSAETLINRINAVIPYTTTDVARAYKEAKAPRKQTLGEAAAKPISGGSGFTEQDEKRLRELEEKLSGSK